MNRKAPFYYEARLPDGRRIGNHVSASVLNRIASRLGWNEHRHMPASEHLIYWAEAGDLAPCAHTAPDGTDLTVGIAYP